VFVTCSDAGDRRLFALDSTFLCCLYKVVVTWLTEVAASLLNFKRALIGNLSSEQISSVVLKFVPGMLSTGLPLELRAVVRNTCLSQVIERHETDSNIAVGSPRAQLWCTKEHRLTIALLAQLYSSVSVYGRDRQRAATSPHSPRVASNKHGAVGACVQPPKGRFCHRIRPVCALRPVCSFLSFLESRCSRVTSTGVEGHKHRHN
jgi:hypothetical protein